LIFLIPLIFAQDINSTKFFPKCARWVLYKQCDSRWANYRLGTSDQTICDAGCAMSSVAMSLATKDEKINGSLPNPATLNDWLIRNGGYVGGDELVWNSVTKLGPMHMVSYTSDLSITQMRDYINKCQPLIVNVRDGTHWVLVIGYDTKSPNTFYVNDPGFNNESYDKSGMSHFVAYSD